jgi:hypothetical protein
VLALPVAIRTLTYKLASRQLKLGFPNFQPQLTQTGLMMLVQTKFEALYTTYLLMQTLVQAFKVPAQLLVTTMVSQLVPQTATGQ